MVKTDNMCILLEGLTFYAYHGVLPQETKVGNEFTVDLRLYANFEKAALTDELEGTVNYAEVFQAVETEMSRPSLLLEHVCGRIGRRLLADFPMIEVVEVRLCKQNPPMGADVRRVGVEMRFSR